VIAKILMQKGGDTNGGKKEQLRLRLYPTEKNQRKNAKREEEHQEV